MGSMQEIFEVHDDGTLRISAVPGDSQRLVVALSGVGTRRHEMPPPELLGSAIGQDRNHVLLVSDKSRSWMNGPGIAERIVATIEAYKSNFPIEEVVTMGNSMGGFAAIVLAGLTEVDVAIAFAPQYSVSPDHLPGERRWAFFTRQIQTFHFPAIDAYPEGETAFYVFHGDDELERMHATRFPHDMRAHHFIFPGRDHNFAVELRKTGDLGKLVQAAMNNRPRRVRMIVEANAGMRRAADPEALRQVQRNEAAR